MQKKRFSKNKIALLVVALVAAGGFALSRPSAKADPGGPRPKAVVERSATCGCCGNFISYLKRKGFDVETKFVEDSAKRDADAGVPDTLGSCHTTYVDGYVVEGHVPVEAIDKLLQERPAIKGIALPAMPSGSPGMPGPKFGAFDIKSFTEDGRIGDFVKL